MSKHYFTPTLVLITYCIATLAFIRVAWSVPQPPTINARALIPLASWQKQFKITDGKDRGRIVPLISQPDLADDRRWQLVFGDYASILFVKNLQGDPMIERLDLFQSRTYIVYEPALPLLPSAVNLAGSTELQTGYKMYNRETGKLKRSGRVIHSVKRISRSQFDTPAGIIDGYYIELDHRMDMEYKSQLRLSLGLGFRLDEGPVYGSGQYTVKKLGLFSETKTAAVALAKR
jgi:hypothetical protein